MIDIVNSVKSFTPTFLHIDNSSLLTTHANMLKSVSEKNEKANQALTELKSAIGQMDLNENDEFIKKDLYDNIKQVVDENTSDAGIGTAYNSIIREVGNIAINPMVNTALENQKKNREYIKSIQDSNHSQYRKDYELNKGYKGIKEDDIVLDDDGNILNIKKWETPNVAEEIDYNNWAADYLKKLVVLDQNGVQHNQFIANDATGRITTDFTQAANYMMWNENLHEYSKITKQEVKDILRKAINSSSNVMDSLVEDYNASIYEDRMNGLIADNGLVRDGVTQDNHGFIYNGAPTTQEEFINNKLDGIAQSFAHESDIKKDTFHIASGAANYAFGRGGGDKTLPNIDYRQSYSEANVLHLNYSIANSYQNAYNIAHDNIVDYVTNNLNPTGEDLQVDENGNVILENGVSVNLQNITQDEINKIKTNFDYLASTQKLTPEQAKQLKYEIDDYYDQMRDAKATIDSYKEGLSDSDKQELDALLRIQSGNIDTKGSIYERRIFASYQNIFTTQAYSTNGSVVTTYDQDVTATLSNTELQKLKDYYSIINYNPAEHQNTDYSIDLETGTITFNKHLSEHDLNIQNYQSLIQDLNNAGINIKPGIFKRLITQNNDKAGKVYDFLADVDSQIRNINGKLKGTPFGEDEFLMASTIMSGESFSARDILEPEIMREKWKTTDAKYSKAEAASKFAQMVKSTSGGALMIYGLDKKNTRLDKIDDSKVRQEEWAQVQNILANDPGNVEFAPCTHATLGPGYIVTINDINEDHTNGKGSQSKVRKQYWIKGIEDDATKAISQSPANKAFSEVAIASQKENGYVNLGFGDRLTDIGNLGIRFNGQQGYLTINGKKVSNQSYNGQESQALKECFIIYNDVYNSIKNGMTQLTENDIARIKLQCQVMAELIEKGCGTKTNYNRNNVYSYLLKYLNLD